MQSTKIFCSFKIAWKNNKKIISNFKNVFNNYFEFFEIIIKNVFKVRNYYFLFQIVSFFDAPIPIRFSVYGAHIWAREIGKSKFERISNKNASMSFQFSFYASKTEKNAIMYSQRDWEIQIQTPTMSFLFSVYASKLEKTQLGI